MNRISRIENIMIHEEIGRWNEEFIHRASREWDEEGEGCFALYIQRYVVKSWIEMVGRN